MSTYNTVIQIFRKTALSAFLVLCLSDSYAQELKFNPFPFWVYTPYIFNPAMTGTKDYASVDLNGLFNGDIKTHVAGGSVRFSKTGPGYYNSPDIMEFRNEGIGAYVVHGTRGPSRTIGMNAAASYQIPLGTRRLTYLSVGLSGKVMYNIFDSLAAGSGLLKSSKLYTDADAGIYVFGSSFYAGVSVTNFLENYSMPDSLGASGIPAGRQYLLTAGYKILLSKKLNIVLEPSLVAIASDSTLKTAYNNIYPLVKLYVDRFCLGSYFLNDGNLSFFFQYKFPGFYIGSYFELPKKSPYFKSDPVIEITMGLNLQKDRSRLSHNSHW